MQLSSNQKRHSFCCRTLSFVEMTKTFFFFSGPIYLAPPLSTWLSAGLSPFTQSRRAPQLYPPLSHTI